MRCTTYTAIINLPGFLPDAEPVTFQSLGEAWDYLADEYEHHAWEVDDKTHRRDRAELKRHRKHPGNVVLSDGYAYEVQVTEVVTADDPCEQCGLSMTLHPYVGHVAASDCQDAAYRYMYQGVGR